MRSMARRVALRRALLARTSINFLSVQDAQRPMGGMGGMDY